MSIPVSKALLAGVNNYLHISDLDGCLNDLETVRKFCRNKLGLEDRQIVILSDKNASRANLLRVGHEWLLETPRIHVLVHWSGHGTSVPGGDEPDGRAEALCAWDADFDGGGLVYDYELREIARLMLAREITVTMVVDACYQGPDWHLRRLENVGVRGITLPLPTPRKPTGLSMRAAFADLPNVVYLSGGTVRQPVADDYIANKYQGAYTWAWYGGVSVHADDSVEQATWRAGDVLQKAGYDQRPQCVGTAANLALPFGQAEAVTP